MRDGVILQSELHASPFNALPSSHCSNAVRKPSPQTGMIGGAPAGGRVGMHAWTFAPPPLEPPETPPELPDVPPEPLDPGADCGTQKLGISPAKVGCEWAPCWRRRGRQSRLCFGLRCRFGRLERSRNRSLLVGTRRW